MSEVTSNSYAAAITSGVKNTRFQLSADVVKRKILIIGTGDPTKEAGLTLNTPILVTSPEDVGNKTGFGFMLHRLAVQAFRGSKGSIETYISVQAEDSGTGVQSAGDIEFAASSGVLAGTLAIYISGILDKPVLTTITDGMTPAQIATAVAASITAIKELPVTAAIGTTNVVVTSKSVGTWGDDISIALNLLEGDETPTGVSAVITDMASGASSDDIDDALNGLGVDDNANANFFTDVIHGYGHLAAALNKISAYVGAGNDKVGCWGELVHKPFRALNGDVATGSAGLAAIKAIGDGRKTDRANGTISAPTSRSHPEEIAAQAMGIMARINNNRAEQNYIDIPLEFIDPGTVADRWTDSYTSRDSAVSSGISPTKVISGVLYLKNVLTYYHPDDVPVTSNGYKSMRNISILQNILASQYATFNNEKWKGISIVDDVTKVSTSVDKEKARDIDSVIDEDIALAEAWESNAWIFTASFTKDQLKSNPPTIRTGNDGFNNQLQVILSGEGNIIDNETLFDVSIAILT